MPNTRTRRTRVPIAMDDDDDTLTAYHEAGHAVVGYALGAAIEAVELDDGVSWHDGHIGDGDGDDGGSLPRRFGHCKVNWGRVDASQAGPAATWQLQRELLTVLAGPVAEMIYRDEPVHPALDGPSQGDWAQAWERCREIMPRPAERTRLLELLTVQLRRALERDEWWAAVAAVADELLAHGVLDREQTDEVLGYWIGRLA
ncbi:MAG: cell division protein FtsH [Planctomycetota bacterium]